MSDLIWSYKELVRFTGWDDPEVRFWAVDRLIRHFPEDCCDDIEKFVLEDHDVTPERVARHLGEHGATRHHAILIRGFKLLRKSPGFTATAVLTLALGIGATSAIFSVLHTIVLRPLPFPNSEQLVTVVEVNKRDGRIRPPAVEVYAAWREQSRTVTSVDAGITGGVDISVSGPAGANRINLGGIALGTLSVLGVEPLVGRTFRLDEVTVEGDTAESLVISYGLWQSHFGGDPNVVGKTIPGWDATWSRTVIGVMPPDFWVDPWMADVDGAFSFWSVVAVYALVLVTGTTVISVVGERAVRKLRSRSR